LLTVAGLFAVIFVSALPGSDAWCSAEVVRSAIPKQAANCFEFWFNRYQAFVAGIVAVVATLTAGYWALSGARGQMAEQRRSADLTIEGIRAQMLQLERLEEERREREHYTARAVLPLALNSIVRYARQCIKATADVGLQLENGHRPVLDVPDIPSEIIAPLQNAIRFADNDKAEALAKLLGWMQVQAARLDGLAERLRDPDEVTIPFEVHGRTIDAAEISVMASQLFDYARGATDRKWQPEIDFNEIRTALRVSDIWDEGYEKLFELIDARERTAAQNQS
jgi:hypothetical protein